MNIILQARRWTLLIVAALALCACSNDDESEEDYGEGSPQASNIIQRKGYQYLYNSKGLITTINRIDTQKDEHGNVLGYDYVTVASFSYPKSNRAVMVNDNGDSFVFAFGADNFAHRIIEKDADGESYLIKLTYDKDGHITKLDDASCDILELKYTNGNLSYIKGNDNDADASATISYGPRTDFYDLGMSPFLFDLSMGPFAGDLNWWFEDLEHALYAGFLGKPFAHNIPSQITSYDKYNGKQYSVISFNTVPDGNGQYTEYFRQETVSGEQ